MGTLRAVEVTHGAAGSHVHLHVFVFLDSAQSVRWQGVGGDAQFEAHFAALASRGPIMRAWQRIVGRAGYCATEHAQDMRPVSLDEAGNSLNRSFVKDGWDAADEVARGASKKGRRGNRTPIVPWPTRIARSGNGIRRQQRGGGDRRRLGVRRRPRRRARDDQPISLPTCGSLAPRRPVFHALALSRTG